MEAKRADELSTIQFMIELYCRKNHQAKLCDECSNLLEYARKRIEYCPKMATKTFCCHCESPCYNQEMRQRIKDVMRYSRPRMIFYKPTLALKHLIQTRKDRKK